MQIFNTTAYSSTAKSNMLYFGAYSDPAPKTAADASRRLSPLTNRVNTTYFVLMKELEKILKTKLTYDAPKGHGTELMARSLPFSEMLEILAQNKFIPADTVTTFEQKWKARYPDPHVLRPNSILDDEGYFGSEVKTVTDWIIKKTPDYTAPVDRHLVAITIYAPHGTSPWRNYINYDFDRFVLALLQTDKTTPQLKLAYERYIKAKAAEDAFRRTYDHLFKNDSPTPTRRDQSAIDMPPSTVRERGGRGRRGGKSTRRPPAQNVLRGEPTEHNAHGAGEKKKTRPDTE